MQIWSKARKRVVAQNAAWIIDHYLDFTIIHYLKIMNFNWRVNPLFINNDVNLYGGKSIIHK